MIWLIVFILATITISTTVKRVRNFERGIKLQMGKFVAILQPGIHLYNPLYQKVFVVNMRKKPSMLNFTSTTNIDLNSELQKIITQELEKEHRQYSE